MSAQRVVLVVTPARNAERYLDETIESVVQQHGDCEVHYHVQDGGSSDATVDIARRWIDRLHAMNGRFYGGVPIHMSCDNAADHSMYDAIQSGFERLLRQVGPPAGRLIAMTWINADDVFGRGAFQTTSRFLSENRECHWVTGVPSIIAEDGSIVDLRDAPYAYSRRHLALGRYDGRSRAFFQQEGTFWTESLWSKVGGLNRRLSLAGDWDLWRRMAQHSPVITLRAVLAHHRRHPRQLTADMNKYWQEIDTVRANDHVKPDIDLEDGDIGEVAGWNQEAERWTKYQINMGGAQEIIDSTRAVEGRSGLRLDFSDETVPVWIRHLSGVSEREDWGRWSDASRAPSVRICSNRPFAAHAVYRLQLAVVHEQCNPVCVTIGSQRFEISASKEPRSESLEVASDTPVDTIDIRPSSWMCPKDQGWSADDRRLGVALHSLEIVPMVSFT